MTKELIIAVFLTGMMSVSGCGVATSQVTDSKEGFYLEGERIYQVTTLDQNTIKDNQSINKIEITTLEYLAGFEGTYAQVLAQITTNEGIEKNDIQLIKIDRNEHDYILDLWHLGNDDFVLITLSK